MGHGVAIEAPAAGRRFGRLVVIAETRKIIPSSPGGLRALVCACDCGNTTVVPVTSLIRTTPVPTQSCGCLHRDVIRDIARTSNRKHGLHDHPLYFTWKNMLARCEDPDHQAYRHYGGRGIRVCDRWHDLAVFVADIERWLGPRPAGMTLDRICNDHDYRLDNVRWATRAQQARNRRQSSVPLRTHGARICQVDGCGKPHRARGMCSTHCNVYYRQVAAAREGALASQGTT